jgi:hypothetical protein
LISTASIAQAQSIDIILDSGQPVCSADVGPNPWIELHVVAVLGGSVPEFQGAQFRISGRPDSWNQENVSWVWDASVTLGYGNPLLAPSDSGNNLGAGGIAAWSSCQPKQGSTRRIGKILILGAPVPENTMLRITGFTVNPNEPHCPMMNRCDNPYYSTVCVQGGSFVLNGTNSKNCSITAVEELTWTAVKGLYQ